MAGKSPMAGEFPAILAEFGPVSRSGTFFPIFLKKTLEALDGGFRVVENRRRVGWLSEMALGWPTAPPETVRAGRVGLSPLRLTDRKYPP